MLLDNYTEYGIVVAMEEMAVSDVATELGVQPRRVRHMIESGQLPARRVGNQWLVHSSRVRALKASPRDAGRPYSQRNAWAILGLAEGREPAWLGLADRERLRMILKEQKLLGLIPKLRKRADIREWYVHPSLLEKIANDPRTVVTGAGAMDELVDESSLEVYLPKSLESDLRDEYFIRDDFEQPNVIARVVDGVWPFDVGQSRASRVVAAVDLQERPGDARGLEVARRVLDRHS